MPSKSDKQRRFILHLRDKYKTKKNTPEKYKWIWDDDWLKVEKTLKEKVYPFELLLKMANTIYSDAVEISKTINKIVARDGSVSLKKILETFNKQLENKGITAKINYKTITINDFNLNSIKDEKLKSILIDEYESLVDLTIHLFYSETIEQHIASKGYKIENKSYLDREIYPLIYDPKNINILPFLHVYSIGDKIFYSAPTIRGFKNLKEIGLAKKESVLRKNQINILKEMLFTFKDITFNDIDDVYDFLEDIRSQKNNLIKESANNYQILIIECELQSILKDKDQNTRKVFLIASDENKKLFLTIKENKNMEIESFKFFIS